MTMRAHTFKFRAGSGIVECSMFRVFCEFCDSFVFLPPSCVVRLRAVCYFYKVEMDVKRAANFSTTEVELLIQLVKKHKAVIECKKTDAVTWKEKNEVWETLSQEFNSLRGTIPRSAKNLREKYLNLKKNTKKKFAEHKVELFKTGGGSYNSPKISTLDNELQLLTGLEFRGLENKFDDDRVLFIIEDPGATEDDSIAIAESDHRLPTPSDQSELTPCHTWTEWSPAVLKRPKSSCLSVSVNKNETAEVPLVVTDVPPTNASTSTTSSSEVNRDVCTEHVKKCTTSPVIRNACGKGNVKTPTRKGKNQLTADCRQKINALSEAKLELIRLQQEAIRQDMEFKRIEHELHVEKLKKELQMMDNVNN